MPYLIAAVLASVDVIIGTPHSYRLKKDPLSRFQKPAYPSSQHGDFSGSSKRATSAGY